MATSAPSEAPVVPIEKVEFDTLVKLYLGAIDRHALGEAMMYESDGEWIALSHAEVERRVEHLAAGLQALGVTTGERVAILSENRPEWAIGDFAILALGAIGVPLYSTLPSNQIAHVLEDSGARTVLVSTREQLEKIVEIRPDMPALEFVIAFDDPGGADGVLTLEDVTRQGEAHIAEGKFPGVRALADDIGPEDVATLIYTSGTTGKPKGVMLTHFNIASNVAATEQHGVFRLTPGMIALSFLPLSHSFERMVDYYFWHSGATIAYVNAVDKVGESMVAVRPHVTAAAPRVFEKIFAKVMGATGLKGILVMWAK
ncbi:MAG: AMP-binding protein, partial [Gemmatimonadota bacterium]